MLICKASELKSQLQRNAFHMHDGPEQMQRDEIFASQLGKEISCKFPSRW
jgi:salicylate hydroxylase